jgi:Ser/Thr protein kinase RdoA (MazF antagonist)
VTDPAPTDPAAGLPPPRLLSTVRAESGLDLVDLIPTGAGESGTTFWVKDRTGTVSLLKILTGPPRERVAYLHAIDAVTSRLRARGYPAPRLLTIGRAAGHAFWIQERLPGSVLESSHHASGHPALARLTPGLLRLNDAQAGLGAAPGLDGGDSGWPDLLTGTLTHGGDGFCLHSTLAARPSLRDLLEIVRRIGDSCGPAIPAGRDFVHFDFAPANLLTDGTAVTGVIDVNPPLLTGDRAFDLATLLFYWYDHDGMRHALRARLLELSSWQVARAYLAHMVLRQVDWSVRHHPQAEATQHHLNLARLVIADITAESR